MKVTFGYRCATEEYPATVLLRRAIRAEQVGFEFICVSDHFHPWFHVNGNACHSWILSSSIGSLTKKVRIGTGITAPIYRYHPAIIAQAFATLGQLFPKRIFLGLGTGEAMNEVPLGFEWPTFKVRYEMFKESLDIIKLLWSKVFVDYDGKYFKLRKANLYVKVEDKVPIYIAASGKTVARLAGKEGDGFMTVGTKLDDYRMSELKYLLEMVRQGAKEAERNYEDMPKMIEFVFSYNEIYEKALSSILKWRVGAVPGILNKNIYDPRELDKLGESVDIKNFEKSVFIATNIEECVKATEGFIKLGFNEIQFHSSSPDEDKFLEEFSKKGLPYLKDTYSY
ncbi:MAG: TIGR03557 family F420-dependent LLM class oxidoreductase [Nitrososphaerales archaeon]